MYNSIVAAYKQKKHEYFKVKVHLQKETNHTMPVLNENDFFFFDHQSLDILHGLMFAQLNMFPPEHLLE